MHAPLGDAVRLAISSWAAEVALTRGASREYAARAQGESAELACGVESDGDTSVDYDE